MDCTEYGRCMFCKRLSKDYEEYINTVEINKRCHHEFLCGKNFRYFSMDGKKVVEKAKELGISVTDVLALMEANINFRRE